MKLGFAKAVMESVRLGFYDGSWINDLKRKKPKRGQMVGDQFISNATYLALKGTTCDDVDAAEMRICEAEASKPFRRKLQSDVWGEDFTKMFAEEECEHEWVSHSENYGADRDGNRGEPQEGHECQKCGEWKR